MYQGTGPGQLSPILDSGESDNASRAPPGGSGVSTPNSNRKKARSPVKHRDDSSSAESLLMAKLDLSQQVSLVPRNSASTPGPRSSAPYPVDTQTTSSHDPQQPGVSYWKPPQYAYATTQPQQRQDQRSPPPVSSTSRDPTPYQYITGDRSIGQSPGAPQSYGPPPAGTTRNNPYQATSTYPPPPTRDQPAVARPPYPDQRSEDLPYPKAVQSSQQIDDQRWRDNAFSTQSPQSARSPRSAGLDRPGDKRSDRYDDSRRVRDGEPRSRDSDSRRAPALAPPQSEDRRWSQSSAGGSRMEAQPTQLLSYGDGRRQSYGDQYRPRGGEQSPRGDERDYSPRYDRETEYGTPPGAGSSWTMSIPERKRQPYQRSGSTVGASDDVSTVSSDRTVRPRTGQRGSDSLKSSPSDPRQTQVREERRQRIEDRVQQTKKIESEIRERERAEDECSRLSALRGWRSSVLEQRSTLAGELRDGLTKAFLDSRAGTSNERGWGKEYGWKQDRAVEKYRDERKELVRRFENNFDASVDTVYDAFKRSPERGTPSTFVATGPKVEVRRGETGAHVQSSYTLTMGEHSFTETSKQTFKDRR